jgi:putative membrane protein
MHPLRLRVTLRIVMIFGAQTVLPSWSALFALDVTLFLMALIYLRGWIRLYTSIPNLISPWRLAAFLAGILSVWIAIGSPLEAFDDVSLSIHMLQHLLLMAIAPPLILLGAPALPLFHGLPRTIARSVVGPFLRWRVVKSLGALLTNPATCWLAATIALVGWHVPAVFTLALRWNWLHELEHACFLVTGLLFWWPVIQPWPSAARWPRWSIPLYLFCATLPCDALSAFLAFCDRVVYAPYLSAPRLLNISPLQDQEFAAALMWTSITIIFLVPAVVVTMQILSPPQEDLSQKAWAGFHTIAGHPMNASKTESTG